MAKGSLLDRINSVNTIKEADILEDSEFFNNKDSIVTHVPALNIALSGELDGGYVPGLTQWAGESKHFKSNFSLLMAKAYLDKYPDAYMVFYDSEFGSPKSYFKSLKIDTNRVIHKPLLNMEQFKFDVVKLLDELDRGDRVIILVDSVGNMASKKEAEDALEGNSKVDMSRPKQLKSIFRTITPYLVLKNIPMVVVNHIYKEQGAMYAKNIVSGGSGIYLSSDSIFIITRQQNKDGTEVAGYNFVINVEKSRHVKEKSKIPVTVSWGEGINRYSGMFDLALEAGLIIQSGAWYTTVDLETGELGAQKYRKAALESPEFMKKLLASQKFKDFVREKYKIAESELVKDEVEDYIEGLEETDEE
ncbi:recombination protein [Caulobacter phage Cr30]|uniref:DNA repair protein n=1 Tax=Caulobacter phage Cr30 TaxID=1357714 RepID=UPI0004A9B4D0|nr:DNA repair protein [Caulobacter phage Cr30]AGS81159.1 recombination protein [Caulobacter phage Cr30]